MDRSNDRFERVRSLAPWLTAGVCVAFILFLELKGSRPAMPAGQHAPPVKVALRDGGEFDLEALRGEVVVLNFWASWCPPCRAEAPLLTRVHERLQREGRARVVGLAMDAPSLSSAEKIGMTYPQALATESLKAAYRVTSLPTTILVGRDGTVIWSYRGEISERQLAAALDKALAAP